MNNKSDLNKTAVEYISKAHKLKNIGNLEGAIIEYKKAIQIQPEVAKYYYYLADSLFKLEKVDESIFYYSKAIELESNESSYYQALGNIYKKLGQWERAISQFKLGIECNPDADNFRLYQGIKEAAAGAGKLNDLIAEYSSQLRSKPNRARLLLYHIAEALVKEGKYEEAQAYYLQVKELNPPKNYQIYLRLGKCFKSQNKLVESRYFYQQDLVENQNSFWSYYGLGDVMIKQGDLEEAEHNFRNMLERYPNHSLCFHKLAMLLTQRNKLREAETLMKKAIELDPKNPIAYAEMSNILTRLAKFSEANSMIRKAIELDQKCIKFYFVLTNVLVLQGKFDEAINFIESKRDQLLDLKDEDSSISQYVGFIKNTRSAFNKEFELLNQSNEEYIHKKICRPISINSLSSLDDFSLENLKGLQESIKFNFNSHSSQAHEQNYVVRSHYINYIKNLMEEEKLLLDPKFSILNIQKQVNQTAAILLDTVYDRGIYFFEDQYILQEIVDSNNSRLNLASVAFPNNVDIYQNVVFGIPAIAKKNYYHRIIDQISSIIFYKKLKLSCPIFCPHFTTLHQIIFDDLQIPHDLIIQDQKLKFKYLITGRYQSDKQLINFYRNIASIVINKNTELKIGKVRDKIYISRRRTNKRVLLNEDKVEELMKSLGFSVLFFEDITFEEQVLLMQTASIVVTPSGAGLTNMLFCKPGTTIVEMFPNENRPLMYYRIAMLCQHNYYPVLGKLRDKSKLNWIIDIEKLKKIIKTLV